MLPINFRAEPCQIALGQRMDRTSRLTVEDPAVKGFDVSKNVAPKPDVGAFSKPSGNDFWMVPGLWTNANSKSVPASWRDAHQHRNPDPFTTPPSSPSVPPAREPVRRLLADQDLYGKVTLADVDRIRREYDPRIYDGS